VRARVAAIAAQDLHRRPGEAAGAAQVGLLDQKVVRTDDHPRLWRHCVWFAHVFDHPVRQGRAPARFGEFYHTDY
jgi:hypothetical protein